MSHDQLIFKTLEHRQDLAWLVSGLLEANHEAQVDAQMVNGNIVFTDLSSGGLVLPHDLLANENHAPELENDGTPFLYTYLVLPATEIAAELEQLKGYTVPVAERWTKDTLPGNILDITKLNGNNAAAAGLAQRMMQYITVKANTEGIYAEVLLQEKYAAAMSIVLAILHQLNSTQDFLDAEVTAKLNVMRAGGSVEILTRAVSDEEIPSQFPGAKRIVTNPQGKDGKIADNSMMLGIVDRTGSLLNIQAGDAIRMQEVVVASNATLMGFIIVLEYLQRSPRKLEVIAPFITQPGVASFLDFCAQRGIDLQVITASIAPALNDNWYVVVPADRGENGEITNALYNHTQTSLGRTGGEEEVYYMGDGGDILNFLLQLPDHSADAVKEYIYPLIAALAQELGGQEHELILQVLPQIAAYMEG